MKPFTILNRFLTITLASAALLTVVSCKKDPAQKPDETITKLVRLEESATNYTTFSYNANGSLSKMNAVEGGIAEEVNLNYTNNKITSATSNSGAMKLNYNVGNQLQQVDLHVGSLDGPAFSYLQYNYQNNVLNNVVTYHYLSAQPNAQPFIKLTYEYYPNGDVKNQREYQYNYVNNQFELAEMHTFEYDNKVNPLVSLGDIYQLSFDMPSKHNPVKDTQTDKEGNLVQTTTYTYTYNNNGYPVQAEKKTAAPGQANPTVSHIKYTYQ